MIFQNPWAWIGAAAIAVPILVHLLTRQRVDRTPFPTLRFLPVLPLATARRHRLTDLALLAVRCGVLLAATWALAQPYLVAAARRGDPATARAIVLDTSASMSRLTGSGVRALDEARARVASLERGPRRSDATTTVESARLALGVAGASAWLDRAAGRRELVVVSDFQRGALGPGELTGLAPDITVRTVKIDVPEASASKAEATAVSVGGGTTLVPTLQLLPDRTDVRWTATAVSVMTRPPETSIQILANPAERPYARAALQSAWRSAIPLSHALAPAIAIVFPGAPERAALRSAGRDLDQRWMFDLVASIRRDQVVARLTDGRPFAAPVVAMVANTPTLLLLLDPADRVVHAAVIAAAARNLVAPDAVEELEPDSISPGELARWTDPRSRSASADARRRAIPPDASDGRWFWGLALLLIGVEAFVRRRRRPAVEPSDERAA